MFSFLRRFIHGKPSTIVEGEWLIHATAQGAIDRIKLAELKEWIDYDGAWVFWITLELKLGQKHQWQDLDMELVKLLRRVAPEKEISASPGKL